MSAVAVFSGLQRGTRGDLLLLCQCCPHHPKILGVVSHGKLTIEKRHNGVHHYVILGPDVLEWLEGSRKIACMCCEEEPRQVLAECRDELLIIRCVRHHKPHFVALARPRLEHLLALSTGQA